MSKSIHNNGDMVEKAKRDVLSERGTHDLDVLCGFVTKNLSRKPFLMVKGVKMAGDVGGYNSRELWSL